MSHYLSDDIMAAFDAMRWRAVRRFAIALGFDGNIGPLVDLTRGEWRCKCPRDLEYDTSINPEYVRACGRCGAERPCPRQAGR